MIKQKQAFKHCPEQGIYGDCQRTAIACLLDLPLDEVPNFANAETWNKPKVFQAAIDAFLNSLGYTRIIIPFVGEARLDDLLEAIKFYNPGIHYLLTGTSSNGTAHVVVCRDNYIIWDPSLDDSGIVGPDEGIYWVEFLVQKTASVFPE